MEIAETEIRQTLRSEYLKGTPKRIIDELVYKIINKALKRLSIPNLRKASLVSLTDFYKRQYAEISRLKPINYTLAYILTTYLAERKLPKNATSFLQKQGIKIEMGKVYSANVYGVPLQKFSKDYIQDNVKPTLERLAKQFPLDPDDVSGRNSLRGRAELEVRYQDHLDNIENLRNEGHKLVICSTHADCSDRCAKWQGRVYSLDGTSGTTDDGRKYIPLEVATDVFYTTKKGKTYKNGLLGFNCRHFLVPYEKGYRFPSPNAKEERKQYAITIKQRELERNVRKYRTEAIESKGIDKVKYLESKKKAEEWNKIYIDFSRRNNRAYYPSRTEVI